MGFHGGIGAGIILGGYIQGTTIVGSTLETVADGSGVNIGIGSVPPNAPSPLQSVGFASSAYSSYPQSVGRGAEVIPLGNSISWLNLTGGANTGDSTAPGLIQLYDGHGTGSLASLAGEVLISGSSVQVNGLPVQTTAYVAILAAQFQTVGTAVGTILTATVATFAHKYRIDCTGYGTQVTAAGNITTRLTIDGVDAIRFLVGYAGASGAVAPNAGGSWTFQGDGSNHTFAFAGNVTAGAFRIAAGAAALIITDLGE